VVTVDDVCAGQPVALIMIGVRGHVSFMPGSVLLGHFARPEPDVRERRSAANNERVEV
jgi:hypothetical protein